MTGSKKHKLSNMIVATEKYNMVEKSVEHFTQHRGNYAQMSDQVMRIRQQALAYLQENGLPTKKSEAYRYTALNKTIDNFTPDDNPKSAFKKADLDAMSLANIEAHVLVFVNGVFNPECSEISGEKGLTVLTMDQAMIDHTDDIAAHFAPDTETDGFVALNTALFKNGAFIKIAKSCTLTKPVLLYFISDTTNGQVFSQPRNLIIAEENSEGSIGEFFHTLGDGPSFSNAVTEIVAKESSRLDYFKIEPDRAKAYHVGTTRVWQKKNSHFEAVTLTLGGTIIRNNLSIVQQDEHCESHMYGLAILHDNQHVDNYTIVDHRMPNSFSNELYKNILDDQSTGVFNGKIFVRQDAQKTNAFQSNRNILLSKDATINTKPQLEIWADDVKCSHGATTGQIDKEQLFYLRSRGLGEDRARAMLLYAFAKDVLDNIRIEEIRDGLDKVIAKRLHNEF